jgi:transposase-like protein
MAKRTIKINIKLPTGIVASKELVEQATSAAQSAVQGAVKELAEAQKLSKDLATKGIRITAEELISRKQSGRGRRPAKSSGKGGAPRKRIVLSEAQRKELVGELKSGAKIAAAAKKYGISTATVMNIKAAAGLIKKRK